MNINLNFDMNQIHEYENKFDKPYINWNDYEKSQFLLSLMNDKISILDNYVESMNNPFETNINNLRELGFQIVYNGKFKYPNTSIPAQEIVMCNKDTGMFCYLTSYQDGPEIGKDTRVNRSHLYFQVSGLKSNEPIELLKKSSGINFNNGTIYRHFNFESVEDIKMLLDNCEFVNNSYNPECNISFINEEDCVKAQIDGITTGDIQKSKIEQMPEDIQEILGYNNSKHL